MRVRPADPNAIIRDPHTKRPLPAEGGEVPDNHFWRRRLRAGEVVLIAAVTQRHVDSAIPPLITRDTRKV